MATNKVPEQNFQPQVRDTTHGPHVHTYIPRSDGVIIANGTEYYPKTTQPSKPVLNPAELGFATPGYHVQPHMMYPYPSCIAGPQIPVNPVFTTTQPISYPQPAYSQIYPWSTPTHTAQDWSKAPYPSSHAQVAGYIHPQPMYGTYGYTASEIQAQQLQCGEEMNKKQEMKPMDDDPLRMYWVRELDNTWTQRNRLTIDSGDIGECRWYAVDGVFYAVRLADS